MTSNSEAPFARQEPPTRTTRRLSVAPDNLLFFIIVGIVLFVPAQYTGATRKKQWVKT